MLRRIRQRQPWLIAEMRAVYLSDGVPQYLDPKAREMLAEGRGYVRQAPPFRTDAHRGRLRYSCVPVARFASHYCVRRSLGDGRPCCRTSRFWHHNAQDNRRRGRAVAAWRRSTPLTLRLFVSKIKLGSTLHSFPMRSRWAQQHYELIGEVPTIASTLLTFKEVSLR
jgi:hypothetical protein